MKFRVREGIVSGVSKVVLVTGAGRGVGRACAVGFARERARVVCAARTRAEIESAAEECRQAGAEAALAVSLDATNPTAIEAAVRRIRGELGSVDVLCHAAGGARTAPFARTDDALWEEMLGANLTSAFYVARALVPDMVAKKSGRLVFIGSTAARTGFRYCAAYTAAKHGLLGMARALALELASEGVTANVVAPGFLDVESTRQSAAAVSQRSGRAVEEVLDSYRGFSPQRRLFTSPEVVAAVLYLASEEARGVNGQCLVLDGGGLVA